MCCRSGFFSAGTGPSGFKGGSTGPRTGVSGLRAAPPAAHPAVPVPVGPFSGRWTAKLEICDAPAYKWKAILQVLPLMVVGLCRIGGSYALAEWAVAMAEWVHHTFWTPEGAQDDDTLAKSNELLYVFEKKCDAIAGLHASNWNFWKMHETSKFTNFIRRLGAARWYSTERRERRHQAVKKWWKEINGKNIEKSLNRW
jgi:hypothetical protein